MSKKKAPTEADLLRIGVTSLPRHWGWHWAWRLPFGWVMVYVLPTPKLAYVKDFSYGLHLIKNSASRHQHVKVVTVRSFKHYYRIAGPFVEETAPKGEVSQARVAHVLAARGCLIPEH